MSSQASRIQQTRSRNHCQVARFANGQNMLVKDGCSNHNDSSSNSKLEKYRMVKNDENQVGERGTPEVEGQTKSQMFKRDRVGKNLEMSEHVTTQCS